MSAPEGQQEFDREMIAELRALSTPEADLLNEVAGLFRRDAPGHLATMRAAMAEGDCDKLHRAAHTLKGSAGNLGLLGLMRRCQVLSELTRGEEAALPPPSTLDSVAECLERALVELDRITG